jgi:hypothetical protein
MTGIRQHRGHCRCGSVAITAAAEPNSSVYCHCDDSRRATGSPVLASVAFPKVAIEWTARTSLKSHRTGTAARLICGECGSPVAQEHESASDRIFFNTGFMDDPAAYPPTAHTFAGKQVSWLKLCDRLPKHEKTVLITTEATGGSTL